MATKPVAIDPAELADRLRQYGAAQAATAVTTELADRPCAEAAIRHLYRAHGRTEPRIVWVPSPNAGFQAASAASHGRDWIRGTYTRGEVGSGSGREWRALAEPFDIDPSWRRGLVRRAEALIRGTLEGPGTGNSWDPAAANVRALGLEGISRIAGHVQAAGRAVRLNELAPDPGPIDPAAIDSIAPGFLGERWTSIVDLMGIELARDIFADAVRDAARAVVTDTHALREAIQAMQPGQFDVDAPALAVVQEVFGRRLYGRNSDPDLHGLAIDARLDLARSAGPWWALDGLAIVSERPLVASVDDRGRLHGQHGPALAWGDGAAIWAWHGVEVNRSTVLAPEAITVASIDAESNIERRRVLIERFGEERLLREGDAKLVDEDATGRLWRRDMPMSWPRDEAVVMVEVLNSTPEPDGSRKTYFLRVPPTTSSARAAVAWTFGLRGDEYRPAIES